MEKKTQDKIKNINWGRWLYGIIGVSAVGLGILLGAMWGQNKNPFLGLLMLIAFGSGVLLIVKCLRYQSEGVYLTPEGEVTTKVIKQANSLNIYAKVDPETKQVVPVKIAFENMDKEKLEGYPRRLRNDNKLYFVHILDIEKQKLIPFRLPDTRFCPPTQLSIPARMSANWAYWKPIPSLFQRIAPWMLVLALIVELFIGLPVAMD